MPTEKLDRDNDPLQLTHGARAPATREAVRAYLVSILVEGMAGDPERLIATAQKLETFIYGEAEPIIGIDPAARDSQTVVHSFDEHGRIAGPGRLMGPGETAHDLRRSSTFPAAGDVSWSTPVEAPKGGAPNVSDQHAPEQQVKRNATASDHPEPAPEPTPEPEPIKPPEPEHAGKVDHKAKGQRAA